MEEVLKNIQSAVELMRQRKLNKIFFHPEDTLHQISKVISKGNEILPLKKITDSLYVGVKELPHMLRSQSEEGRLIEFRLNSYYFAFFVGLLNYCLERYSFFVHFLDLDILNFKRGRLFTDIHIKKIC